MRKTVFALISGSAALALAACAPAEEDKAAMEAEAEEPAAAEATDEGDDAMAEEGSEGDDGRDGTGNPIGPGAPEADEAAAE